jgi:hypothetical protein
VRRLGTSNVADLFRLGDPAQLRAMLTEAGFRDVEISPLAMTARFPDPEGFLETEIEMAITAVRSTRHLDAAARHQLVTAIADSMAGPLHEITRDDHAVIRFHAHVAHAKKR